MAALEPVVFVTMNSFRYWAAPANKNVPVTRRVQPTSVQRRDIVFKRIRVRVAF